MNMTRGQKIKLQDLTPSHSLLVGINIVNDKQGSFDISCFGVDEQGKLSDDRYFIFYNQPASPEGSIRKLGSINGDLERFEIDLSRLPPSIRRLVFTINRDGPGTMAQIVSGYLRILGDGERELARFSFSGTDFSTEKALIAGEIYFKDLWRLAAVGQGFNGGLSALLKYFGGEEVEVSEPPLAATAFSAPHVLLEKRIEKEAPELVSLVKKATVSLKKAGLETHKAKVALCLDVSGSMRPLYKAGKVQELAERVLALGCHFDDDGSIDIFLFGTDAAFAGEMTITNYRGFVDRLKTSSEWKNVGGGTEYSRAIQVIRHHYFPDAKGSERSKVLQAKLPVYVMFITDGDTSNKSQTRKQMSWASYEPIFWQFMAIGKDKFAFLTDLDQMSGRFVDNAGFFKVGDPQAVPDDELYRLLMAEYPKWVRFARDKGLLS